MSLALWKGPARIDTHHHIVPDFYREWLVSRGLEAGGLPIPTWSAEASLKLMRHTRTTTAILSVSTPGVEPATGAGEAAAMARELNDYTRQVVLDHPGRFGFFATVPLPDVEGSIAEMHRAYDDLDADGVILHANSKGVYLGDPSFDPLMAALDERSAVVFVHPQELPGGSVPGLPAYAADFLLDTTRAALNLSRHGVLDRYPRIRFILAHGGGMIPYAAFRLTTSASPKGKALDGFSHLRRFYFDTALTPSPFSMPALLRFARRGHILFGTDFPYGPGPIDRLFTDLLSIYPTLQRRAIDRKNAERLFPRYAS